MKADYEIGGIWGDVITWWEPEKFMSEKLTDESLFKVYGFKQRIPKVGDTLIGEFESSFMSFVFTKVDHCHDPHDMFFATVRLTGQTKKE